MGVTGLTTFINDRNEVRNGEFMIDMIEEIRQFKRHTSRTPIICIDFAAFGGNYFCSGRDAAFGLRWKQLLFTIRRFFQVLKDAGARLVFFIEGPILPEKRLCYMARQNNDYNRNNKVMNKLKEGRLEKLNQVRIRPNIDKYIRKNIKYLGMWIQALEVEADLELARFARKEDVLAVLTNDSDFLIFPGDFHLWSIQDLDMRSFVTKELSRVNLRRALGLRQNQMPLFATLCGNDMLMSVKLKSLHDKILAENKSKFKGIANFVKNLQPYFLNSSDIENVCLLLKCSRKDIENSLRSYDALPIRQMDRDTDPLMQKLRADERIHIYINLKGIPVTMYNTFENIDEPNFEKSQTELALWIHRCQLGILLKHKAAQSRDPENDQRLKRKVCLKRSHACGYELVQVDPEYPPFFIPPLRIFLYRSPSDGLDNLRYDLVRWCISDKLSVKRIEKVKSVLVPIVSTLCYLVKEGGFEIEEADLILLSYNDVLNNTVPRKIGRVKDLNPRAFQLVITYLEIQNHIIRFFATIGLRQFATYEAFDGVYFHNLYNDWKNMNSIDKQKQLRTISNMRLYAS